MNKALWVGMNGREIEGGEGRRVSCMPCVFSVSLWLAVIGHQSSVASYEMR